MEKHHQPTYWSYNAGGGDGFEPVKNTKSHGPSPVHPIPDPPLPRSGGVSGWTMSSSPSTYTVSKRRSSGGDSEIKRKKRVAVYKAYAVEGKVKASIRTSFRWVKTKYSKLLHRY